MTGEVGDRKHRRQSARCARDRVAERRESARCLRKARRFAGFAVLKAPDVASGLLEMGYLANADDEARLIQPRYRARLAKAIARAIDRYFHARGKAAGR